MFVVWGPNQYDLLHKVDTDLTNQSEIESDLNDLAESDAFEPLCLPISVPNHRAVPRLAFDLEVRPSRIVSAVEQRQPRRGYFLKPAIAIRDPQLHPRPERPLPLHLDGASGLRPGRGQQILDPLPSLLDEADHGSLAVAAAGQDRRLGQGRQRW